MIKVGEYVRTQDGFIFKVADIKHDEDWKDDWVKGDIICSGEWKEYIIKHSKNIIDLIEVGDIITEIKVRQPERIGTIKINNIEMLDRFRNGDAIYSIVTKEQFANMEYRLEENK